MHDALPVTVAARLSGLTPDVIRAWERRYGVVAPERGPRGARLYSATDVERLRLLRRVVERGRRIGDVARLTSRELAALVRRAEATIATAAPALPARLLAVVERFDPEGLDAGLGEALVSLGARDFVTQIAGPLLEEVGRRWESGELSVAQEHLVSATLRHLLGGAIRERGRSRGPLLLLATPEGERHDLGLVLVGLIAVDAGLGLCFLGAELPASDIVTAARRAAVAAVALGVTFHGNRASASREVRAVRRRLPAETELWLGGLDAAAVARSLRERGVRVLGTADQVETETRRLRAQRPRRWVG